MIFDSVGWFTFLIVFAILAKSLWFFYYFMLYAVKDVVYAPYNGKVAMIVPIFNEDEAILEQTIKRVKAAEGIHEVIYVNDGSTNNAKAILDRYNGGDYTIVELKENRGKRVAQFEGMKNISPDIDVVVFMDSDTLLLRNSITELVKPMNEESIGGVTACIKVANRDKGLLTKSIAAMYWSASNIWRKAPSKVGYMQVTNGQLSCYRTELLWKLMPGYTDQVFMGRKCTLSDDRYITHYLQTEFGKKIVYAEKAVAFTVVPETLQKAYKMFLRLKLGSIREALLIGRKIRKKPLLVVDVWANHLIALFQTIVRIAILIIAVRNPVILVYYFGIILIVSLMFALDMIVKNIKEVPYRILFSILDEVYFRWVFLHALFTIRNQNNWGTR